MQDRYAYVHKGGDNWVRVKNLGWLLKHWKEAEIMFIELERDVKHPSPHWEGQLTVQGKGWVYTTAWASLSMCVEWLNRPVFRGLPLMYSGLLTRC